MKVQSGQLVELKDFYKTGGNVDAQPKNKAQRKEYYTEKSSSASQPESQVLSHINSVRLPGKKKMALDESSEYSSDTSDSDSQNFRVSNSSSCKKKKKSLKTSVRVQRLEKLRGVQKGRTKASKEQNAVVVDWKDFTNSNIPVGWKPGPG